MKVEDVMTRDVRCCFACDPTTRAAQIMWDWDIGIVPVLAGDEVVGVVTDRDIAMAAYTQGKPLGQINVAALMSAKLWSCSPSDLIETVERQMAEHRVRRLPVLDASRLVGIISLNDIARASARAPRKVAPTLLTRTLGAICEPRGDSPEA